MKVLFINGRCGSGSTGRICTNIADILKSQGHEAYIAFGHGESDYSGAFKIAGKVNYYVHNVLSRLIDAEGLASIIATRRLLHFMNRVNPDIVHIHNIHGHFVNYPMLFHYIERQGIRVVWTLHDCWSFTGRCAHFDLVKCNKWMTGCGGCKYLKSYPATYVDRSAQGWIRKRGLFLSVAENMTMVPVSHWLEGLLKQSYLRNVNSQVIYNGIDMSVFKPTPISSQMRTLGLESSKYVLGVASPWGAYKGLSDFYVIRKQLPSDIKIVLVGLTKEEIIDLPDGIIGVERTNSASDLAAFYSSAIALVNTTYTDTCPTVNMESLACGTPVITYRTGGSPELVMEGVTGWVVEKGDKSAMVESILKVINSTTCLSSNCTQYAIEHFDSKKCFIHYINLYNSIF